MSSGSCSVIFLYIFICGVSVPDGAVCSLGALTCGAQGTCAIHVVSEIINWDEFGRFSDSARRFF